MKHILEIFDDIIASHRSIDMAESEFRMLCTDDENVRQQYRDYCRREGLSEKKAFTDYCQEVFDTENDKWEILRDEDDY